jgi:hypothetical protein
MTTYKIIRFFKNSKVRNEIVETGLTLEDAKEWCMSDESSSTSCSDAKGYPLRTKGAWFEGYDPE